MNCRKRFGEFLCLFAILANTGLSVTDSALEERLERLWTTNARQRAADAWKMPKEERKRLLSEFNNRLFAGKWGPPSSFDNGDSIRVRLGDRELTQSKVQKMVSDGIHNDPGFGSSGSPIAIQYLAPYAFTKESYEVIWAGDVRTAPLSFLITNVIFEILSDSSAFTGEVTNWARQTRGPDPERRRAEFQRWWEENKIHFEREDYKAVKPGRPIPNVIEVMDENRSKAGLPSLEETRPKQSAPPPPPAMPQPMPAPVAQTPASANEGHAPMWPWVAGILALIVIVAVALKRRSS